MADPDILVGPNAYVEKAPAKINLDLLVTARRPDGYHELDSLVVFAPPADHIEVQPSAEWSLTASGPFAGDLPEPENDMTLRAARLLAEQTGMACPPMAFTLEKNLPVAAGIGGGSGDAAAVMRLLRRAWELDITDERLRDIGLQLGADLPACIYGRPVRMRGIGERLDPVRGLPEMPLVLVNPRIPVATARVFAGLELPDAAPVRSSFPTRASLVQLAIWLASSRNDLEPPALVVEPRIGSVLDALRAAPDVILARLSGSGATCFGIFRTRASAEEAARTIALNQPEWWVVSTLAGGET